MVHRWFRLPAARAQGANTYFRGGRTCVRPDKQARRKVCTSATVRWPEVRSLQSIPRILSFPGSPGARAEPGPLPVSPAAARSTRPWPLGPLRSASPPRFTAPYQPSGLTIGHACAAPVRSTVAARSLTRRCSTPASRATRRRSWATTAAMVMEASAARASDAPGAKQRQQRRLLLVERVGVG